MNYKNYLYSLRFFILFALVFSVFFAFYGYWVAKSFPAKAALIVERFEGAFGPLLEAHPLVQFIVVFLNNSFTLILTILLGVIFGIFPLLVLFSNGTLFGVFAFLWQKEMPLTDFFLVTLPHGLIEIPILIIGAAIGLKIGQTALKKVFQKQGQIKPELFLALKFYLKILLPLLALAAFIEIFLSPLLLR